ncbi:CMRF35-like molecule 8 isoform X2 [Tachysurus vachellii]|uniref:CMRF35-like molecule 8 isoform X2 n=1 Tax=Tachysurus vachellii TaxID=175792 RepID=UPI00296B1A27|nr:CMRF35-like molecule 8 isoform X2 [Tachysurus vachellii]
MKNFFSFITFYLISGSVHCFDVISYPGGRVIINFKNQAFTSSVYFCKFKANTECKELITARVSELNNLIHKDRINLFYTEGIISLIYINLSLQDTGMYRFGDLNWNYDINLKVNSDPCCSGTKAVTGQLGQTLMISCFYPVEFETNPKSFYRLDGFNEAELIRTSGTEQHQDDRFFISDDRKNKVFSVNITNLRKDDGGLYSCAFTEDMRSFSYQSFFTVFQLQATEVTKDTTENLDGKLDTSESGSTFIIIIIITVCIFVTLLLMGGFILVYKLRHRTQDSVPISQRTETNNTAADYENNLLHIQNIMMSPVYQSLTPNTKQSDSVYQSLDTNTNQSHSVYQNLEANTNQSDSAYQSLTPSTNQSDSAYQSLTPSTNQSDSVYQVLDINAN